MRGLVSGPADRFLGRLHSLEGVKVHSIAKEILSDPESKPNSLHFDILSIFLKANFVRLVTTNFDNHFSNASHHLYGQSPPEIFYAPALPMGQRFKGTFQHSIFHYSTIPFLHYSIIPLFHYSIIPLLNHSYLNESTGLAVAVLKV